MFLEYTILFKYFLFCVILAVLLFGVSFFLVFQSPYAEKTSSYECGFNPWGDARSKFEVRFYLVAILFIIFDLEVTFLYPFILALPDVSIFGFYTLVFFLLVLTLGFVYEWMKGALDWNQ